MQQQYQSALTLLSDEGLLGSSSLPESSSCKLEWVSDNEAHSQQNTLK